MTLHPLLQSILDFLKKHLAIAVIVAALAVNDLVTWVELRHATSWILGDLSTLAATSILLLANAVTAAFFFDGLEEKYLKRLHYVAAFLYAVIALAVYAAGVDQGRQHFPAALAEAAFFGISPKHAVMIGAAVVGAALALTTLAFWSVIGALIQLHVARQRATRRALSVDPGGPVDNLLNLQDRASWEQRR